MARGYSPSDGTVPLMTEYVTTRYYRAPEVMISPHNYSEQSEENSLHFHVCPSKLTSMYKSTFGL